MNQFLLVGLGGFLGSALRYWMTQVVRNWTSHPLPWGTITVNLLGSFAIGILFTALRDHRSFTPLYLFFGVGLLGGFTTFSTFSLETVELLRRGDLALAVTNMVLSVVVCLLAVFAGMTAGNSLHKYLA